MTKKPASFSEYISWILQQYQKAKKELSPQTLYRLVDIKEKSNQEYELSFQLIGKAIIFKATPEEILENDKFIEYFSSKDIHVITQLVCKKEGLPKNKIIGKIFSTEENELLFRIEHLEKSIATESTASKLSINKDLIRNLSSEDAHMIGYAAAQEQQKNDSEAIKNLRDSYSSVLKKSYTD